MLLKEFLTTKKPRIYLAFLATLLPLVIGATAVIIHSLATSKTLNDRVALSAELIDLAEEAEESLGDYLRYSSYLMVEPMMIGELSEPKILAYDKHVEAIDSIRIKDSEANYALTIEAMRAKLRNEILPMDTEVLELLFVEPEKAKQQYFESLASYQEDYAKLSSDLKHGITADSQKLKASLTRSLDQVIWNICFATLIGLIAIIVFMSKIINKMLRSENDVTQLLDSIANGVTFIESNGCLSSKRSSKFSMILPKGHDALSIYQLYDVLFKLDKQTIDEFLSLCWPKKLDNDFYSDFATTSTLLPNCFQYTDEVWDDEKGEPATITRTVELSLIPIYDKEQNLSRILLSVRDETESVQLKEKNKSQVEASARVSKVAQSLSAFITFLNEQVEILKTNDKILRTLDHSKKIGSISLGSASHLKTALHTLKGNLGIYSFGNLANRVHGLESMLTEHSEQISPFVEEWEGIKDQWKFESSELERTFDLGNKKHSLEVSKEQVGSLEEHLKSLNDEDGLKMVENFYLCDVREAFLRFENYIDDLNRKFPAKKVKLGYSKDSDRISHDELGPINGCLTHLIRNSFDHGIETSCDRIEQTKDAIGSITLSAYRTANDSIHIVIRDDGGGINTEALAKKAETTGFWSKAIANNATEQQKIDLIFEEGMSSKEAVTDISGRGVGMSAVKKTIESLGGTLSVYSEVGRGTQFEMTIPRVKLLKAA